MLLKARLSKSLTKIFCFGLAVFLYLPSMGQVFISKDPAYLKVKSEQNNLTSTYRQTSPDTTITELHNFSRRNFLGNVGLASPDYFFRQGTSDLGFKFFNPPTDFDRIKEQQVNYYRSRGPYADLTGITGSKMLQSFKMLFTHTYKEKVNITLRFNRYSSQGYYLKQQTYANNFYLSSNYTSNNKRFGYYFYVLNNGNKSQENGGIKVPTLANSAPVDKKLFPVNLSKANRDNRETKLQFNPWMRINAIQDTLQGVNHYLQLKSKGSLSSYKYKDPNILIDKFYNSNNIDTFSLDSSHVQQLSNEVDYTLLTADEKFGFSAGYRNEISATWQYGDKLYYNHLLVSGLKYNSFIGNKDSNGIVNKSVESQINAQYVVAGYNAENFKIDSRFKYNFNLAAKRNIYLNLLYESRSPDRIYRNWTSNHFIWDNTFLKPQDQFQAKFGASLGRKFNASLFLQNVFNYLYFDEAAYPRQAVKWINNTGFNLNYSDVYLKHLGVEIDYVFQSTSDERIMRIPKNSITAKLFYTGSLFKNALQLQIGSQLQMYQGFVAYDFMPSTQVFYLQNSFKTEAFPYVDVYLNARIRPVSFFLKLENVLGELAGSNYAFVPGYYQPARAFRMGIKWMFFD